MIKIGFVYDDKTKTLRATSSTDNQDSGLFDFGNKVEFDSYKKIPDRYDYEVITRGYFTGTGVGFNENLVTFSHPELSSDNMQGKAGYNNQSVSVSKGINSFTSDNVGGEIAQYVYVIYYRYNESNSQGVGPFYVAESDLSAFKSSLTKSVVSLVFKIPHRAKSGFKKASLPYVYSGQPGEAILENFVRPDYSTSSTSFGFGGFLGLFPIKLRSNNLPSAAGCLGPMNSRNDLTMKARPFYVETILYSIYNSTPQNVTLVKHPYFAGTDDVTFQYGGKDGSSSDSILTISDVVNIAMRNDLMNNHESDDTLVNLISV